MHRLLLTSLFIMGTAFSAGAQDGQSFEEIPADRALGADKPSLDLVLSPENDLLSDSSIDAVEIRKKIPHSGLYYDSDSLVPDGALGNSAGPREVDPKYEPGSRFIVVQKSASATSFEAQLVAGRRALQLERYTSALEIYEKLYKKSPRNRAILMGLAVSQQQSGFFESAIATYEELLQIDPENTEATVNMLGILKTQYPAIAYRKLKDLWDKNGRNPAIAAQLGLTSALGGHAQEALQYLGVAASMEPNNAQHYYNMAVVADRAGISKDALEFYQKALEIDVVYGASRSIPRDQVYDRLAYLRRL